MKTVKQLLEEYDVLTNKVTNENKRLVELVRDGLLEEEKLPLIERCLSMDPELTTIAERNAVNELLESLTTFFLLEKKDEKKENTYDKLAKKLSNLGKSEDDPNHPTNRQAPALLMFQRKAIRVYPDNMKVVVYYSPYLDKYISIPFGGKSLTVTTNVNESLEFAKKVSLSQKRGQRPATASTTDDDSWQKRSDDQEDKYVAKHSKPRHAATNVAANAQLRSKERTDDAKRRIVSRATTARAAAKFKTGSGALRNATRNNMDRASDLGHTGRLIAGVGTIGAGLAARAINKVRGRLEEQALEEAKSSYKNIFKMPVPKRKAAKKSPSLSDMFKSKPSKATAPKKAAAAKAEPKKEAPKASAPQKKEDVSSLLAKYRKAHHDHARSTGATKYKSWDSAKGKHVEKDLKTELGAYKERLASKIKAAGGQIPDIETPEQKKRDPSRKPPPALAEGMKDWLPGYKDSTDQFNNDVADAKKGGVTSTLKKFAKEKVPKALMAIAPTKGAQVAIQGGKSVLSSKSSFMGRGTKPSPKTAPTRARPVRAAGAAAAGAGVGSSLTNNNSQVDSSSQGSDRKSADLAAGRQNVASRNREVNVGTSASQVRLQQRRGEVPVAESHLKAIQKLVEENGETLDMSFGEHTISINNRIGKKLLKIYESLNKENRQKVETMLNESADSARKVINFVVRN